MKIKKSWQETIYFNLFRGSALVGIAILIVVLLLLFSSGHSVLNSRFLTSPWQHRDITQGGIFPAIIGSLYLGIGVMLISFPLGIGTAIFI